MNKVTAPGVANLAHQGAILRHPDVPLDNTRGASDPRDCHFQI